MPRVSKEVSALIEQVDRRRDLCDLHENLSLDLRIRVKAMAWDFFCMNYSNTDSMYMAQKHFNLLNSQKG